MAVQQRLRDYYIPEIVSITYEGQYVEAPKPVEWYPDQLAWFMTTPKNVVRRFKPFASFQKFLVAETDVGNITRQEVVSMIPPLCMDLKPGMTVLDLCAAPGSKSAQLIEMIHAGEEERCKLVASASSAGGAVPEGSDFEDDGRSTGLLIANDVDYKRAHMLVHQMKRLSSPNIIVTNHDATVFPSIRIPSLPPLDGKPMPNRYLKFDRILADVPCSGDGTLRKNMEIWKNWTPSNGLGLHSTQVRILIRALQMLKVGGRVVYSTCSMNPVEDEAVLAEAIQRCGGSQLVQLLETKDLLPGLKRAPGLMKWNVMDKTGRIWEDYDAVSKHKEEFGDDGLTRLTESMFPPKEHVPLDRAMRIYPHLQDTGAFFIAILEKKSEIKARPEEKSATATLVTAKISPVDTTGSNAELEAGANGSVTDPSTITNEHTDAAGKRKRADEEQSDRDASATKRRKSEENGENGDRPSIVDSAPAQSSTQPQQGLMNPKKKPRNQPFEEPFKYLPSTIPEISQIVSFYNLSPRFPLSRFMVRNADGNATKKIYYTNALARDILQENEGKGLKFVHAGVIMFVKQDTPSPEVCPWRIQTDGLRLLETWVGPERVVKLTKKETLRRLLIEMFPRFVGEGAEQLGEVFEQVKRIGMGCCVLVVEPTEAATTAADGPDGEGLTERMVFPLWKSVHSLNLMLPKEERKAMLLRLFNDDTPLVNTSKNWVDQQKKNGAGDGGKTSDVNGNASASASANGVKNEAKEPDLIDMLEEIVDARRRNSSSPEADSKPNDGESGNVVDEADGEAIVEVDADDLLAAADKLDDEEKGEGAAAADEDDDNEDGGMALP